MRRSRYRYSTTEPTYEHLEIFKMNDTRPYIRKDWNEDPFWNAFRETPLTRKQSAAVFEPASPPRTLFLKAWDHAVSSPDYDKREWMELQRYLENRLPGVFAPTLRRGS